MSLEAITWAFDQKLPCSQKMVLVALADQANHDDECWPSHSHLAERCGLSRQHVITVLGELEARGFVFITSRARKNGADSSNLYILAVPHEERRGERKDGSLVQAPRVSGHVYVFGDGDVRCKIGITRHLERRRRMLEASVGRALGVVGTINCDMATARNLERAAHEHFNACREKGEWFSVQGIVALDWLRTRASEVVSTEFTPIREGGVSADMTPGVNSVDRGVSTHATRILEPTIDNPSEEPSSARAARAQAPLPGLSDANGSAQKQTKPSHRSDLDAAFDAYNQTAERSGWPICQMRSEMRKGHLRKRLVECGGIDGWRAALAKAEASDFLCGRAPPRDGQQPFRADLDFLLQQKSFVRLMEGKYDNRSSHTNGNGSGRIREAARTAAERLGIGSEDRRVQESDLGTQRY